MDDKQADISDKIQRHDPYQHLKEFRFFAPLPLDRLTELGLLLVSGLYPTGEKIFSYGDPGDKIFFICRGQVALSLTDDLDHTETFGTAGKGDCVGEVAVIAGGKRSADGRVTAELVTLELHKTDLDQFLKVCPEAQLLLLKHMAHRLEAASDRDRQYMHRLSHALQRRRTPADDRMAKIVQFLGSQWFLGIQIMGSALWILFNRSAKAFDPFPYAFLALILAAEALVVALLILRYQNREEDDARVRDAAQDRAADEINRRLDEILKRIP